MAGPELYIGLISGTSVDAIDAALVEIDGRRSRLVASHTEPLPDKLRTGLLEHCSPDATTLPALGGLDIRVGRHFALAANRLLANHDVGYEEIRAIGSHGQTLFHAPSSPTPFTLQIGDPNVMAAETSIPVVADFRRMDMALGGQGAPLAPLFHQQTLHSDDRVRAVLNLGGIANLTFLPRDRNAPVRGLDTGPASGLMDDWTQRHLGQPYDDEGKWARSGTAVPELLRHLLDDPYFQAPAPKSTGREYFSAAWLDQQLRSGGHEKLAPEDVQATLLELTAHTVVDALRYAEPVPEELVICGGGGHNRQLMQRIAELAKPATVLPASDLGIPVDQVEAMCFAWLARQRLHEVPVDGRLLTGASRPAILGGVWLPPGSDGE